jgi:citrate/tricarballylate utilization protein
MHYALDRSAPYGLLSVPKLLGIPGGILLVLGTVGLAWLKIKAERDLSAPALRGGDMAFVLLLAATGATGLALYAASGTSLVGALLAVHLGVVLAFFLTAPYSKMVHGFYRLAALARDAQQRET